MTVDIGKVMTVEMRVAELPTHGKPFELVLHHSAAVRTVIGISQDTLVGWSRMLGDAMVVQANHGAKTDHG